jgi:hypothetical protein
MGDLKTVEKRSYIPAASSVLRTRTLIAAVLATGLAQMALAIPASFNGSGELIAVLTPGASLPTGTRLMVLYTGIAVAGIGAAALLAAALTMIGMRGRTDDALQDLEQLDA